MKDYMLHIVVYVMVLFIGTHDDIIALTLFSIIMHIIALQALNELYAGPGEGIC